MCSGKNKPIKISLTSKGYKVITIAFTLLFTALLGVLIINYHQIPWYAIAFLTFVLLFAVYGCIAGFVHRIKLDISKKKLLISTFKCRIIPIDELESLTVDIQNSINSHKYCFIKVTLKNGQVFKISGFSSIFGKEDVKTTRKIISYLISEIEK